MPAKPQEVPGYPVTDSDGRFPSLMKLEDSLADPNLSGRTLGQYIDAAGYELMLDPQITGDVLQQFIIAVGMALARKDFTTLKDSGSLRQTCYSQLLTLLQYPHPIEGYDDLQKDILQFAPEVDTHTEKVRMIASYFYIAQMAQNDEEKRNCIKTMLFMVNESETTETQEALMKMFFSRPSAAIYATQVIYQTVIDKYKKASTSEEEIKEGYAMACMILECPPKSSCTDTAFAYSNIYQRFTDMYRIPTHFTPSSSDSLVPLLRIAEEEYLHREIETK
jgi:hypothetical protein